MNKKLTLISSIFIIVIFFSIFFIISNNKKEIVLEPEINIKTEENILKDNIISDDKENPNIILFYGDGCPHCAIVEEYINQNGIENKISFIKKEVYYNQNNAFDLESKAKICGIPTDSIGVPFLWDGEKCLIGDQDIIEFFKLKTN